MQVRVIEKEAREKGPHFAGKLLDMTWTVKLWLNQQDPDSDDPVYTKDLTHDYSRHEKQEHLVEQDARIDTFLEKEAKKAISAYLNEKALMIDKHITDRTSALRSKLDAEYGEI
jgi:hypothetical protein